MEGIVVDVPVYADDPVLHAKIPNVLEAKVFTEWLGKIEKDPLLFIKNVLVQSIDMFGRRVGFIKFKAGVIDVPGIVFMRGGAVGVLVILEWKEYTILTHQARVPIGVNSLPEIPAGMLDGSGNFKGVAAEEIAEECNIVISENELIDLTGMAYGEQWQGIIPSAGGCDEFIRLYMFRRVVDSDVLKELEGRLTGLRQEGERIKLHIVPLEDCWKMTPDVKALSCLALYDRLLLAGKIEKTERTGPYLAELQEPVQQPVGSGGDGSNSGLSKDGLARLAGITESDDIQLSPTGSKGGSDLGSEGTSRVSLGGSSDGGTSSSSAGGSGITSSRHKGRMDPQRRSYSRSTIKTMTKELEAKEATVSALRDQVAVLEQEKAAMEARLIKSEKTAEFLGAENTTLKEAADAGSKR
eukprot:gene1380-19822_t